MNQFVKAHGLGNEYITLNLEEINFKLTKEKIITLCNVHFGIGSDGILLKTNSEKAEFGLRIFNPDGSEAEKSGNGLRIFAKYLYDYGFAKSRDFSIETPGGIVQAHVIETIGNKAVKIKVDMGKAIFNSERIPVNVVSEECMDYSLTAGNKSFLINCVSVGNPHCVVMKESLDEEELKTFGPQIETNSLFPNRINVQFARLIGRDTIEIRIWERGAGYTLASGSSSCAVASVFRKKGLVGNTVAMKMPGGSLEIEIDDEWNIKLTGEVKEIATGTLSDELLD